jgi:arylsulfatase A-like enzyme
MSSKRIFFVFIGMFILTVPINAVARTVTIQDLVSQTQVKDKTSTIITTNLYLGIRDSADNTDVAKLQRFLRATGDFTYPYITGYFGPVTRTAVQKYQIRNKIVPYINAPGYGLVGPSTRAYIRLNSGITPKPVVPVTPITKSGQTIITTGTRGTTGTRRVTGTGQIPKSCSFDGKDIKSGNSVTAYKSLTVPHGSTCVSQSRVCTDGSLSGSYTFSSCLVNSSVNKSCILDGVTIPNSGSILAYKTPNLGSSCSSSSSQIKRICTDGVLSGSDIYSKRLCTENDLISPNSLNLGTKGADTAITTLTDGTMLMIQSTAGRLYNKSDKYLTYKIFVLESKDNGKTWKDKSVAAEYKETAIIGYGYKKFTKIWGVTNPYSILQTKSGRIIATYKYRKYKKGGNSSTHYIETIYSDDKGKTWKHLGTVYSRSAPDSQVDVGGLWEPYIFEPSNRINVLQVYFARERPQKESCPGLAGKGQDIVMSESIDGGKTWSEPSIVLRHGRSREGMPSVIELPGGRMVLAHEHARYQSCSNTKPQSGLVPAVAISDDGGKTWTDSTAYKPSNDKIRSGWVFMQKLIDGRLALRFSEEVSPGSNIRYSKLLLTKNIPTSTEYPIWDTNPIKTMNGNILWGTLGQAKNGDIVVTGVSNAYKKQMYRVIPFSMLPPLKVNTSAPTCTLTADNSPVTIGDVLNMSWISNGAISARLTNTLGLNIQTAITGSRISDTSKLSPQTIDYTLTVKNAIGVTNTCTESVVITEPAPLASCTLDGVTIADGASRNFFSVATVTKPVLCSSVQQTRTCNDGTLSGDNSFKYKRCLRINPTAPTCSLSADNSPVTIGDILKMSWISNGAISAKLTNTLGLDIPTAITGSRTADTSKLSPQTIDYKLTVKNAIGVTNTCTESVVITEPAPLASCTFNGSTNIKNGNSVTAYKNATVQQGSTCISQSRTCNDGTLSGDYEFSSCSVDDPAPLASCTLDGVTIADGASRNFFNTSTVTAPDTCVSHRQKRTCNNGVLSGSNLYDKKTCTVEEDIPTAARPNILYILLDDAGYDSFTDPSITKPNIEKFATESTRFEQFYTNPMCTPTRMSLLSGNWALKYGIQWVCGSTAKYGIPSSDVTLPQSLKKAGYTTATFGKWHAGSRRSEYDASEKFDYSVISIGPTKNGYFNPEYIINGVKQPRMTGDEHLTEVTANHLIDYLKNGINKDKPFFINYWLNAPHGPHQPNNYWWSRYGKLPWGNPNKPINYKALFSQADENIGRVLKVIDSDPYLKKNTIVLLGSDNGGTKTAHPNGNGILRGWKTDVFEGGIRSPLYVRWPGHTQAGVINNGSVLAVWDIFPTLAELGGAIAPNNIPGKSFASLIRGTVSNISRDTTLFWSHKVFNEHLHNHIIKPEYVQVSYAVRDGIWKLVFEPLSVNGKPRRGKSMLFDMSKGIRERNVDDVSSSNPAKVAELEEKYLQWYLNTSKIPALFASKTGAVTKVGDVYTFSIGGGLVSLLNRLSFDTTRLDLTFSAKIMPSGRQNKNRMIAKRRGSWKLKINKDNRLELDISGKYLQNPRDTHLKRTTISVIGDTVLQDGKTYDVAFTLYAFKSENTVAKIYMRESTGNNPMILVGTSEVPVPNSNDNTITLGSGINGIKAFIGKIGNVQIFKAPLTKKQIERVVGMGYKYKK